MTAAPAPSTVGHLEALTAGLPDGYGLVVSMLDRRTHTMRRAVDELATRANAAAMAQRCAQLAVAADVYVSATATDEATFTDICRRGRGARGGAGDARALVAVWADIDCGTEGHNADKRYPPDLDAARRVLDAGPTPTMTVATGGGLHGWWLLAGPHLIDSTEARERAAALADGWVRTIARQALDAGGWCIDTGVGDLARVLRVCGTHNHKTGTPRRVTLDRCGAWPIGGLDGAAPWRPGPLYDVEHLEALLDPLDEPEATPRPPRRAAGAVPRGDGFLDALRGVPWADIWPPDWSYVGASTAVGEPVELWRRPGASSPHSATCWGEACRVWSDAITGLPAGGYSKAAVLAWRLDCGLSELATAIGRAARRSLQGAA